MIKEHYYPFYSYINLVGSLFVIDIFCFAYVDSSETKR